MAKKEEDKGRLKEPSVVVKPLGRLGGLDGIHVALIVLVAIMAALLLAVSSFNRPTQAVPNNATNRTACAYAFSNGTCASPLHNASQVRLSIERLIASYSYLNTSYALLPYITETNSMSLTYLPDSGEWYAVAPISQPGVNGTIYLSFLYNDKNSSITPFIQAVKPSLTTQNYVKSYGVVMLQGKVACSTASPLQIYWFIDPYSPGSVRSLETMEGIQSRFPAGVQTRLEVLYTPYSQQIALSHGIGNTQAFGKYLFCASQQQNFSRFVNSVNSSYDGLYMSPQFLSTLANDSGLNRIALDSCIANSSVVIARQSVLAAYYNVTSTPMIVTNCQYQSIPQAEQYAMCAANSTFCRQ